MTTSIDNTTRPVSFIEFHGMTLLVVENGGKNYVEVKPLGALAGLDWRTLRDTVQKEDNSILYGTQRLIPPSFNVLGSPSTPETAAGSSAGEGLGGPRPPLDPDSDIADGVEQTENRVQKGVLHILFERVQMFLARVNTSQMRVQGNVIGANYLLALQIEWAQVLHKHDMGELTANKSAKDEAGAIANLMKTRALAKPHEIAAFDAMVRDAMARMGYPVAIDPQQSLPL